MKTAKSTPTQRAAPSRAAKPLLTTLTTTFVHTTVTGTVDMSLWQPECLDCVGPPLLQNEDFDLPSAELKELLKDCQSTKRKVGRVVHQCAPSFFFTSDLAVQDQSEVALVASMITPASQIYDTQGGA